GRDESCRELRREARGEGEHDECECDPGTAKVVSERHVVRAPGLKSHDDDEHDRQQRRSADADIGSLLREKLAHFPAVGRQHCRSPAHRSTLCLPTRPSVSWKKSASSVAASGTSAAMPTPDSTSTRVRSRTLGSSAVKRTSSPSSSSSRTPAIRAQIACVCSASVVRSRYRGAVLACRPLSAPS